MCSSDLIAWYVAHYMGGHPALGFVAALVLAPLLVGGLAVAADMTILKRIEYDPERTIVATIGLLYIIQQLTLMTYGPEARPVEPPFNERIALPWFEFGEAGLEFYYPWGLSTTSYKLAVIGAAAAVLGCEGAGEDARSGAADRVAGAGLVGQHRGDVGEGVGMVAGRVDDKEIGQSFEHGVDLLGDVADRGRGVGVDRERVGELWSRRLGGHGRV